MSKPTPSQERSWSSSALSREKALEEWNKWAEDYTEPVRLELLDTENFEVDWTSYGIGQLRLLHIFACPQRVTNIGDVDDGKHHASLIHLLQMRQGDMTIHLHDRTVDVPQGSWVLLNHADQYVLEMLTRHEAVDVSLPHGWLDRYLPEPEKMMKRAISGNEGWGAPLAALLDTIIHGGLDETPLPHPMIAEQIGRLLALAADHEPGESSKMHRRQLTSRILRHIDEHYAKPDLSPSIVAKEIGISKRYLQSLLASSGTGFVAELNAARLIHASEVLARESTEEIRISDIAYQVGILDPAYFTRLFKKRYSMTPREWRQSMLAQEQS